MCGQGSREAVHWAMSTVYSGATGLWNLGDYVRVRVRVTAASETSSRKNCIHTCTHTHTHKIGTPGIKEHGTTTIQ